MQRERVHLELVWDTRSGVTESPVWDSRTRTLFFVDLFAGKVHAWGVEDRSQRVWEMPEAVGSLGLCASGRLLVALRHRVVFLDLRTGKITEFTDRVASEPDENKFNDGKVGPDRCFWVGTQCPRGVSDPKGKLYRVTPDGQFELKAEGYMTSNGLAWTPDGKTMFHSDSRQAFIEAWDFDTATGGLTNHRRLATLSDDEGRPDGAACDSDGYYWSAGASAGCLNKFTASGAIAAKIELSIPAPSMPCFAEDWLYITSIRNRREHLSEQHPTLGSVFRMKTPATGAVIPTFADQ